MVFRWGRFSDIGLETALRRLFDALQASGSEVSFRFSDFGLQSRLSEQMRRLVRPVLDERTEASLREGVAIYKKLLDELDVDRNTMPLTAAALLRRCLNRRPNFLDPPPEAPYTLTEGALRRTGDAGWTPVLDRKLMARAQHFLQSSHEIYGADAASAGINRRDLVEDHKGLDGSHVPRYAVFVDHLAQSIVVAIRGTATLRDAIMDLVAEPVQALGGRGLSHKGILRAAQEMLPEVMDSVLRAAREYPSYTLVTTGHSLGAGAALLLTLLVRDKRNLWIEKLPSGALEQMQCFAFAPPPVWSPLEALTPLDTQHMYSFCHNTDMIPRASLRSLQVQGSRHIYVNTIDVDDTKRIAAILASDGAAVVDEVLGKVEDALLRSDADLRRGALRVPDGRSIPLRPTMFIPGRIFHLYPADASWSKSAVHAPKAGEGEVLAGKGDGEGARVQDNLDGNVPWESDAKSQARVREQGSTASSTSIYQTPPEQGASLRVGRTGRVPDPIDHYRIQEVSAELMSEAPIIESDYFAMDHTTPAYINAFRKLELPRVEASGATADTSEGWWVLKVARGMCSS